jgi:hypothetical protein
MSMCVVPYFLPIIDNTAPLSPAYQDRSYRSPKVVAADASGVLAALYATMKLQLRVRLGDCIFAIVCICERASLYRRLSKPLPEACKVRLAHGLHRA